MPDTSTKFVPGYVTDVAQRPKYCSVCAKMPIKSQSMLTPTVIKV